MIKTITVEELNKVKNDVAIQLIDVREPSEYEENNIGGELIPLGDIPKSLDRVNQDKKVVIMCRSGKRSLNAAEIIADQLGFDEVYNLTGGILAWDEKIR